MKERLQKIISSAGIASRRAAEEMITSGRVTVNGERAVLGQSADPDTDIVAVDGHALEINEERTYIMLYKPRGYVTTMSDERGRKTVAELTRDVGCRVYPVGRLDMDSEGLLIMTDDGALAQKLMHPSHGVVKKYHVWVKGEDMDDAMVKLSCDIELDGRTVRAVKVEALQEKKGGAVLEISIKEGRNRQVRRMCEASGLTVQRLKRVGEGEIMLSGVKPGKWRKLTVTEIKYLQNSM